MPGSPEITAGRALAAAEAAGFSAAAIVPLGEAADDSLDPWIEAGLHGTMAYLERHAPLRRSPREAFPGFESALIVLAEYGDSGPSPSDPTVANVSRYALPDDYHGTIKASLRRVGESLAREHPSLHSRALVDANPLNEKVLASIGGLGWVGKNGNLIRQGQGSWFFLGVLLLSARLDARAPAAPDRCGTCARCIAACPTRAIVEPYVVDARLCISYLTIEHRGSIPRNLRTAIGNRIFGCDDCQEVCPWNRFAHRGPREPFLPRRGLKGRPLGSWLRIDPAEFAAVFEGSAVLRTGYEGFVRNVLIAAGNSGDPGLVEPVLAIMASPSPILRGHAAWALGRLGGEQASRALLARAAAEQDPEVAEEVEDALRASRSP